MIAPSYANKHYTSAHRRFLQAAIEGILDECFPRFFGPDIRQRLAGKLIECFEQQVRETSTLKAGQCLWNAVAIETRADHPRLRLLPVVLTLVDDADVTRLAAGTPLRAVASTVIARMLQEAYAQGALLSMRDIALLTFHHDASISIYRQAWETEHKQVLPHPGSLQDMGSCLTHKVAIVVKVVYEQKDPRQVAQATHHSQQAVDRYLRDFHRVRTCYQRQPELEFICQVTGMSSQLVKQYLEIIQTHEHGIQPNEHGIQPNEPPEADSPSANGATITSA